MAEPATGEESWVVPTALDGERVDRAVALLTGQPRQRVAELVAGGGVRLGGRVVAARSRRVRAGEVLSADVRTMDVPGDQAPQADPGVAFTVVYEDGDLAVVDKPAGLVVHPGHGNRRGTLVSGLLARYPELNELRGEPGWADRPGIVHRLDQGTSGLLVVARTAGARRELVAQLAAHGMERRYAVLVSGELDADEGVIDAPLGRSPRHPTAMAVRVGGRSARTHYRVVARYREPRPVTELECRLETGRTHQIRVHLAAIGHPVLGDDRYDGAGAGAARPDRVLPAGRPWLHAARLAFTHPSTGRRLELASPLPGDLRAARARFR